MQDYNTEQGLALSSISCCYTDRSGAVWFGTYGGGVSRFDGKAFINFTKIQGLSNNTVYCIIEDLQGNMWFGTEGHGVDRYDGKTFRNYAVNGSNSTLRCMACDKKGRLWLGTDKGLSVYDGKSFCEKTPRSLKNSRIMSIYEDRSGNLWLGSDHGVMACYAGGTYTHYTTKEGLGDNMVYCMSEDNRGNLWLGTGNGISCFDGKTFSGYGMAKAPEHNPVKALAKDKSGTLWFASFGGGAMSLGQDGKWTRFTKATSGLIDDKLSSVTVDKEGHIWFGSFGHGLSCFDGGIFSYLTRGNGLTGDKVRCILEDRKGNLWFGTDGHGISCFDGSSFTNYTVRNGLPNNNIWCSYEDRNGKLWLGTYGGGLTCFDGRTFTSFSTAQGLCSDKILCITEDKKGNLWLGTDTGGVMCYNGKTFIKYSTSEGLAHNSVFCSFMDKRGDLWFGTFGGGLSRYNGKGFTNYTTADGLTDNTILCIAEDKCGNLWFGTDGGGLNRFDGKTFNCYTSVHGLNNEIYDVLVDKAGNIVLGTNMGISVLAGFEKKHPGAAGEASEADHRHRLAPSNDMPNEKLETGYAPVFQEYNQHSGFLIRDVNSNAMLCDSKGILWAGCGDEKLARLNYNAFKRNKVLPGACLQSIRLRNGNICWSSLVPGISDQGVVSSQTGTEQSSSQTHAPIQAVIIEETLLFGKQLSEEERDNMRRKYKNLQFDSIARFSFLPYNLRLPFDLNYVTFDYSALVPGDFSNVCFQYMLDGYDKEWGPVTDKTSATFGNIKEGTYNFVLRAGNRTGGWGPPVMYSFRVLPPPYRTWWAYALYTLGCVLLVQLYIHLREKRLKRENTDLEEKIRIQKQVAAERAKMMGDILQRNKNLEQFSYIVSHNLRAPVANILGGMQLLQSAGLNKRDEEYLTKGLLNSVHTLDEVIKDLNQILQLRDNVNEKKEFVDFNKLVTDIRYSLSKMFEDNRVEVATDFEQAAGMYTLRSYIYSIFLNLISNSIKYRKPDEDPVITITARKQGDTIELIFKDNGLGIDLSLFGDHLFGLYKRFHPHLEGKGIGLFMVKSQVEVLGGQISLTSEVNKGTTFTLVFKTSQEITGSDPIIG